MSNRTFTCPRLRVLGTLCGLLLLPALASHALRDDAPVLLKMKFKQGDVTKYKMTMSMDMTANVSGQETPMVMKMEMTTEQKVGNVQPDGSAEVTSITHDQKITVNDMDTPGTDVPPVTTTYDAQGNIKSVKGLENTPGAGMMSKMFGSGTPNVLFSDKPVKIGDTWTLPLKLPGLTGKGTVKSTYVKNEVVNGQETAHIHMEMTIPMNLSMGADGSLTDDPSKAVMKMTGEIVGTSEVNFAIDAGKIVRTLSKGDITMKMESGPAATGATPALEMKGKQKANMEIVP